MDTTNGLIGRLYIKLTKSGSDLRAISAMNLVWPGLDTNTCVIRVKLTLGRVIVAALIEWLIVTHEKSKLTYGK